MCERMMYRIGTSKRWQLPFHTEAEGCEQWEKAENHSRRYRAINTLWTSFGGRGTSGAPTNISAFFISVL